jgi:F-type H+-transporting ATPase subunit b
MVIMNLFNFYIPEWFFVALNLLILIFALKRILWDRVRKVLDERQAVVAKAMQDSEEAAKRKSEIDELHAKLEADMGALTVALMKEARTNAGKEYDRIVAEAEAKSAMIISAAKTKAQQEHNSILLDVKGQVASTAVEAVGMLLRENMDNARNARLLEDFLSEGEKTA